MGIYVVEMSAQTASETAIQVINARFTTTLPERHSVPEDPAIFGHLDEGNRHYEPCERHAWLDVPRALVGS